jgi:hypothetical protein
LGDIGLKADGLMTCPYGDYFSYEGVGVGVMDICIIGSPDSDRLPRGFFNKLSRTQESTLFL